MRQRWVRGVGGVGRCGPGGRVDGLVTALVGMARHESARPSCLTPTALSNALLSSVQVKLEKTRLEPAGEGKDQKALGTGAHLSHVGWDAVRQLHGNCGRARAALPVGVHGMPQRHVLHILQEQR